jgi:hypothetical protein
LLGAVGLAIDGAHLYAQRQMAQTAADAAAQAGIMSIFDGTNGAGPAAFGTGASFTCTTTDARTPCVYARLNGFGGTAADTVVVDFPAAATVGLSSGSLSSTDPVNLLRVTAQRDVNTTLIRFVGPSLTTIKARGTAAIVETPSAIPIIVTHTTHPSKGGALSFNGNPTITIIGGPNKSIQVNSGDDPGAIDTTSCGNATVDLSKAGPNGKGADFGNSGGPTAGPCFTFIPGVGSYVDPASAVKDPLKDVPVPSSTGLALNPPPDPTIALGSNGCVQVAGGPATCTLYKPGLYNTAAGITIKDSKSSGLALFAPGMYYISQGGFNMQSNSAAAMATGFGADPLFPEIGNAGMVVFNTGTGANDIFSFSSNAGALSPGIQLHGAPENSIWDGILFYEDPTPNGGSHTGLPSANPGHQIWGGGTLSLTGTVYINSRSNVTSTSFQALTFGGGGGSNTTLTGEIIVNTLSLGGNGTINMNLSSVTRLVRQVALVQ